MQFFPLHGVYGWPWNNFFVRAIAVVLVVFFLHRATQKVIQRTK